MVITKQLELNGRTLVIETGKMAKQADGSVTVPKALGSGHLSWHHAAFRAIQ